MKILKHTHPMYFKWFKYLFAVSAFLMPLYFLYSIFSKYPITDIFSLPSILPLLITLTFQPIFILIAAYYFQDITLTNEGLLVEFLWKELSVPWDKLIEIKPSYISWMAPQNAKTYIVLTTALTLFHRCFGLLYGSSVKPAFIIYPAISDYQNLVETIKNHVRKR